MQKPKNAETPLSHLRLGDFTGFLFPTLLPNQGYPLSILKMIEFIKKHTHRLSDLCLKHSVKRLTVFGSAHHGNFDPDKSDLDFCVEFLNLDSDKHADAYFGLLFALEDLFSRRVDLVEKKSVSNPYFLKELETEHQELYAA